MGDQWVSMGSAICAPRAPIIQITFTRIGAGDDALGALSRASTTRVGHRSSETYTLDRLGMHLYFMFSPRTHACALAYGTLLVCYYTICDLLVFIVVVVVGAIYDGGWWQP